MRSPVLLIVFNRPEPTAKVLEAIRAARPSRLYVAADGPRRDRAGEAARCEETRRIATEVHWQCQVKTLFRSENLGCKQAVSQGIDWFFQNEQQGIILEDDCLPNPTFFRYCDELLDYYHDDHEIGLISGDNFQLGRTYGNSSYYFSRYSHIWGWASWRRTWQLYDRNATAWPSFDAAGGLERVLGNRRREIRHWRGIFSAVHANKIDTWDYQLNLTMWVNRMRAILPQRNLISNIGFGADATHTKRISKYADMATEDMAFPLQHPTDRTECAAADNYTAERIFLQPLPQRVWGQIRGTLGI